MFSKADLRHATLVRPQGRGKCFRRLEILSQLLFCQFKTLLLHIYFVFVFPQNLCSPNGWINVRWKQRSHLNCIAGLVLSCIWVSNWIQMRWMWKSFANQGLTWDGLRMWLSASNFHWQKPCAHSICGKPHHRFLTIIKAGDKAILDAKQACFIFQMNCAECVTVFGSAPECVCGYGERNACSWKHYWSQRLTEKERKWSEVKSYISYY